MRLLTAISNWSSPPARNERGRQRCSRGVAIPQSSRWRPLSDDSHNTSSLPPHRSARCSTKTSAWRPRSEASMHPHTRPLTSPHVPRLLTPPEVADALRTSTKAIYAMVERLQLPGVIRIGRRILVREDVLLHWL